MAHTLAIQGSNTKKEAYISLLCFVGSIYVCHIRLNATILLSCRHSCSPINCFERGVKGQGAISCDQAGGWVDTQRLLQFSRHVLSQLARKLVFPLHAVDASNGCNSEQCGRSRCNNGLRVYVAVLRFRRKHFHLNTAFVTIVDGVKGGGEVSIKCVLLFTHRLTAIIAKTSHYIQCASE